MKRELVIAQDCQIEREKLKAGTVVGTVEGEGESRKIVSTHPEVTRGHIEARLGGVIVERAAASEPAKGKAKTQAKVETEKTKNEEPPKA